ncbi:GDSL-type esterase/lipase family protein [Myxococcota bacterium]
MRARIRRGSELATTRHMAGSADRPPIPPASIQVERTVGLLVAMGCCGLVLVFLGSGSPDPGLSHVEPNHGQLSSSEAQASSGGFAHPPTSSYQRARNAQRGAGPQGTEEPRAPTPWLQHFQRAFRNLQAAPSSHVRVLWLGDSHTAAGYWVDQVRTELAARFGHGGLGFLRFETGPQRTRWTNQLITGRWVKQPGHPARAVQSADGVFGLGGTRLVPASRRASLSIQLGRQAVRGKARWGLAYRLPAPEARFQVAVDGGPPIPIVGAVGRVEHLSFEGQPDGEFELEPLQGRPEFLGITVEGTEPGLVVDMIGIPGARAATTLAWREREWVESVRKRLPVLAVVAFGTNEVVAPDPPENYGRALTLLVERLRRANLDCDCLLVGPTPVEVVAGRTHPNVAKMDQVARDTAHSLRCGYFSPYRAMGGEGGYARWSSERPRLTVGDRVHFSAAGYARLGSLVAQLLLGSVD